MPDLDIDRASRLVETIDSLDYLIGVAHEVLEIHRSFPEDMREAIDDRADFRQELRLFSLQIAMLSEGTQLRMIDVLTTARNAVTDQYLRSCGN